MSEKINLGDRLVANARLALAHTRGEYDAPKVKRVLVGPRDSSDPPTVGRSLRYAVVIESAGEGFSTYARDVPGCIATGATVEEAIAQLREALLTHLRLLAEDGTPAPEPRTQVAMIEVESTVPAA